MTEDTDLEALEKQAFRKFYDDGLFDIYLGLLLALMPLAGYLETLFDNESLTLLVTAGAYVPLVAGFILLRKRIVKPRLGTFKPSPRRKRKINAVRAVLMGSVLLGLAAWAIGGLAYRGDLDITAPEVFFPLLWLVNSVVVFSAMAYFLDVRRLYAYGWVFGTALFLDFTVSKGLDVDLPVIVSFGVPGAIIAVVGVVLFVRFLRTYPVIAPEERALRGNHS